MKKIAFLALLCLLTIPAFSQEEFFGEKSGITGSFSRGFDIDKTELSTGGGLGFHLKGGFMGGIGIAEDIPMVYIGYMTKPTKLTAQHPLKAFIGASVASSNFDVKIWSFNIDLIKCFFVQNNYPFSIDFSISPQIATGLDDNNSYTDMPTIESNTVMGFGFKQAFIAKSRVYPIVGARYLLDINSHHYFFVSAGLNINLQRF